MTEGVAGSGATTFDRYSKQVDLTIRGDDWFRSYDEKTYHAAASGSERLKEACNKLFWKFELQHRLPHGYGKKFQLGGYRR